MTKADDDYQTVLSRDPVAAPADYYEHYPFTGGPDAVDAARYFDPAFQALETERLWSRVWQFACREEELPEPGDILEYAIADRSYLIVRGDDGAVRAFHNACLHRGTRLCAGRTSVPSLRCRYHGFTWALDGQLAHVPAAHEFPYIDDAGYRLPEIRVATWQGFVFVNPDPDAAPLLDYLEVIPEHFRGFSDYSAKYIHGYYQKVLPANWKAALEAFLEALHLIETHRQMCSFASDVAHQYDVYPGATHVSRFVGAVGVASPNLGRELGEQDIIDAAFALMSGTPAPALPPGGTARRAMADMARSSLGAINGEDYGACSDAEAIDGAQYLVFPNMVLFRGFGFPIVYRFRPNGRDPESAIYDMLIMRNIPAHALRPESATPVDMGDASYRQAVAELPGWLAEVYDQDVDNLAEQQAGLHNLRDGKVHFARFQESRLRHFHMVLDSYIARKIGDRAATTSAPPPSVGE